MLELKDLRAGYGDAEVLHGISIEVRERSLVALVGGNSAGKSTIAGAIAGIVPARSGVVLFEGHDINAMSAHERVRAGIVLVPEGRKLFPLLSVEETLVASSSFAPVRSRRKQNIERMYAMFPRLEERRTQLASTMSGGEQQMLAIGRALMTNPRLLILDEATEGLAPLVRAEIWQCLATLKREGLTLIVVDKNIAPLARIADRHYIVEKGRVAWQGDSATLLADTRVLQEYLGV